MLSTFKAYDAFLDSAQVSTATFLTFNELCHELNSTSLSASKSYICLKHDVETSCRKALEIARIEHSHGIKATYFFQDYLLHKQHNIYLIQLIGSLGHEIGFHYDSLDRARGNYRLALEDFSRSLSLFSRNNLSVTSVCSHGNALISRTGWRSNKDLSPLIVKSYAPLNDVVNTVSRYPGLISYFSDAGYTFACIHNFNDDDHEYQVPVAMTTLSDVISNDRPVSILSIHTHRFTRYGFIWSLRSSFLYILRLLYRFFKSIPIASYLIPNLYRIGKFL